jgi:uncharacterized damage-inducible protein DinB
MDLATSFLEHSRHYLALEYPTKIRRCLDVIPPHVLWRRTDPQSNSIGNLILHLSGNVRQWIVSGVGGAPDARNRRGEFEARRGEGADELFAQLRRTLDEADTVIASLAAEQLLESRAIQGRDVTVLDAIYHVVEHFSLHTGQIILLAKSAAPDRIRFYEDVGGLAMPRWMDDT